MTILNAENITKVINGDASLINELPINEQNLLHTCYDVAGKPQVTKDSLICVLHNLKNGKISKEDAQKWASFVRCGYLSGTKFPIAPVYVEYDLSCEDELVEVVGRLYELGDLIDGEMTNEEIDSHLEVLKKL